MCGCTSRHSGNVGDILLNTFLRSEHTCSIKDVHLYRPASRGGWLAASGVALEDAEGLARRSGHAAIALFSIT
jgi:hypothetical protein